MIKTKSVIVMTALALVLGGCNHLGGVYGGLGRPGDFSYQSKHCKVAFGLSGNISGTTYSSPGETFSLEIPDLGPEAECRDLARSNGHGDGKALAVSMQSWPLKCEKFEVGEQHIPAGIAFRDGKYFDLELAAIRQGRKARIITRETVDTRFGKATYAYITVDNFAPCSSITFFDGKRTVKRAKAHIFGYWFVYNGIAYSVLFRRSDQTFGNHVGNLSGFREKSKIRLDALFKTFKISQGA